MTVGIGAFFSRSPVAALNALQNSMMLSPRWPSAGPIGGDGLALPAGTCSLMYPTIFFAISLYLTLAGFGNGPPPGLRATGTLRSQFLDLRVFQFDRRRTTEDRHRD